MNIHRFASPPLIPSAGRRTRLLVRLSCSTLLWVGALWLLLYLSPTPALLAAEDTLCPPYPSLHQRFGFNFSAHSGQTIENYDTAPLHSGWYLDYAYHITPTETSDLRYLQMIRAQVRRQANFTATVQAALQANPGLIWILGNEPDRAGQDGLTPTEYATFYHDLYMLIKAYDPHSQVAIGGVVQPTPLRLRYLSMTLDAYQAQYGVAMPVDIWTTHGFILPENYVSGASIPPGLELYASEGMTYTVRDHDNLRFFKENLIALRRWLAEHGYRDRPLLLTEYGILYPERIGKIELYPYAKVRDFMLGTFDFLLNAKDEQLGYPGDENRLVQSWSWFSLNDPPYDPQTGQGFNGNLYDPVSFQILPLGQDYAGYAAPLVQPNVDLAVTDLAVDPPSVLITDTTPVSVTITLVNGGSVAAQNVVVQLWLGDPANGGTLIGEKTPITAVADRCRAKVAVTFPWQPSTLPGAYTLYAVLHTNDSTELDPTNNSSQQLFHVYTTPLNSDLYLPVLHR